MRIGKSRFYHVLQFILILGSHDDHVGQMPQVDDIVNALMRRAIIRNNACSIKGKNNRDIHQADIVVELVISPL